MRCIQCQTDNNLKDRTANFGHCASCNHKFVFEPTAMKRVKITDPMFKRTLDELSANNTLFFTQKQLIYSLDKRLRQPNLATGRKDAGALTFLSINMIIFGTVFFGAFGYVGLVISGRLPSILPFIIVNIVLQFIALLASFSGSISKKLDSKGRRSHAFTLINTGFFILLVGIPISVTVSLFLLFVEVVLMGMGSIYLGNRSLGLKIAQEVLFSQGELQGWLQRWQEVNGTVFRLLAPPIKKKGVATVNQDVTAYSFDRLVVCQTAEVAQMLISNNFHFENNSAILSIDGYPEDIFDITMQMLRRNADLKVYLLHDCSPQGMSMLHQLKTSDRWFKDSNVSIVDVGLTPNRVMTSKHLFIRTSTNFADAAKQISPSEWTGLSPDEVTWLTEGNYVELESFTPQQLIQVLNRGIAGTLILGESDAYTTIGGYDGSIYAAESFG
jgi:hypothetical protein